MTAPQPQEYISEEAYLVFERASLTKHEYYHGRVYAMTGAKEAHNLIAGNIPLRHFTVNFVVNPAVFIQATCA